MSIDHEIFRRPFHKVIKNEALDFRYLLLEYYKSLRISEIDLVVLLFIDHLIIKGTDFITPDLINLQTQIEQKAIDEAMVRLVNKGLLEYTTRNGKMITSLNPLRDKLRQLFLLDYEQEKESKANEQYTNEIEEVFVFITNKFGRSLSPIELQTVKQWFEYGYSKQMIVDAIEESISKKRYSLKAIDKRLLKLSTAVDYKDEGVSAQDSKYRKNIAATLEEVKKEFDDKN